MFSKVDNIYMADGENYLSKIYRKDGTWAYFVRDKSDGRNVIYYHTDEYDLDAAYKDLCNTMRNCMPSVKIPTLP